MATQRFLLKVLNGLYSGSELPLEAGEYAFGNAADNDVNIEDPALRAQEGRLQVSADGVVLQLEPSDRTVHVGGRPHVEHTITLQPYVPVYLGEFCFALGLEGEQWPEMDMGRYEPEPEPEPDSEGASSDETQSQGQGQPDGTADPAVADQVDTNDGQDVGSTALDLSQDDMALDSYEDDAGEDEPAEAGTNRKAKVVVVSLVITLLFIGLFVGMNTWQENRAEQLRREQQRISNEELIMEVIDQSGLRVEIREPEMPGGRPRLSGYIASEKERAAFIAELDRVGARYQSDVYVVEQMLQAGYSLLNAFSFRGVDLAAGRRPGTLLAKGYIENLERWLKIKVVVERDIEGLQALVDEVDTPAIRLGKLEESILRAGLDKEVKLYLSPDGLILARTSLSFENEPKWKILEDAFKKSFGNEPRLVTLIDDNNWIRIVAINFSGPVPYIVLEDGRKYIEGSNLDNGYKLKEISPNGVILQGQFGDRVMPLKLTN